jgi:4-amino-4-deoxy-L-arabinose transferase-like glycosyltransferase
VRRAAEAAGGRAARAGGPVAALLLVLAVAVGVRVVNLRWMAAQPVSSHQFTWEESDMATHWRWAGRILAGDLLSRDPYQPYPSWMQKIAPLETWDRWHGPGVFIKAPLYPYVLAGMRAVVGDDYLAIGACHLALGVLNVALVFLLAARYFDTATATAAGLCAALYGPGLLYETLLLRDGLAVTVSLLLLLALSRCTTAARGPWLLAGLTFALALLARELVAPFAALVALWTWQRFGTHRRDWLGALGAFALGTLLGLLPLAARNLAVGAPLWALSAVGVEGIVYGHAVDTAPTEFRVPEATAEILRAADGRVGEAIRLTLATYHGDWKQLLRNEAARTAAIFSGLEGADNANWYYFAARSKLLAWSLRYEIVLGLGLVGLWLARARVRGDDRILLYFLGINLAALQFVPVIGRYRLVPTAVLFVYAGVTVAAVLRALRAGDWRGAMGPALASALVVIVSARLLLVPGVIERCRPSEYQVVAIRAAERQDAAAYVGALDEMLGCLVAYADRPALPPGFHPFAQEFVGVAARLGVAADGIAGLERLIAAYPGDPVLPRMLAAARLPRAQP